MRVNRKKVRLGRTFEKDEIFTPISPSERLSFMWELTSELWSLRNPKDVEQRLQRNVTNLIKQ